MVYGFERQNIWVVSQISWGRIYLSWIFPVWVKLEFRGGGSKFQGVAFFLNGVTNFHIILKEILDPNMWKIITPTPVGEEITLPTGGNLPTKTIIPYCLKLLFWYKFNWIRCLCDKNIRMRPSTLATLVDVMVDYENKSYISGCMDQLRMLVSQIFFTLGIWKWIMWDTFLFRHIYLRWELPGNYRV